MRRQKKILEQIKSKEQEKTKSFDPMKILRKADFKWVLILCHGGKFCLQVMKGDKVVMTRTDSKYVIRCKNGGR